MTNFKNGKIYTIRNHQDPSLIYVGSTVQPLSHRWGNHKISAKTDTERRLYKQINNNWNDWYITLEIEYPCENKEQLKKKEGEIIRQIGNLNHQIAGRTQKEWYEDNKDIIIEKTKEYYKENKDKLREQYKEYYENNIDKIKEYREEYYKENKDKLREQHKEYYEEHKEKIKEQVKEYREENKEKIKEYREKNKEKIKEKIKEYREKNKEKNECECGCNCLKNNYARHLKSKRHQDFINQQPHAQ